jgi:hypothetical protein
VLALTEPDMVLLRLRVDFLAGAAEEAGGTDMVLVRARVDFLAGAADIVLLRVRDGLGFAGGFSDSGAGAVGAGPGESPISKNVLWGASTTGVGAGVAGAGASGGGSAVISTVSLSLSLVLLVLVLVAVAAGLGEKLPSLLTLAGDRCVLMVLLRASGDFLGVATGDETSGALGEALATGLLT